jgi:drug/metabolite transporter (DMT)-like permease
MHAPAPVASTAPGLLSPRILLYFFIITLIWGSTWLVIKTQLGVVPASWSVAWRFLIGGSAMMTMCLVTGKSLRLDWRGHAFALTVAVMQFVLNFNLVYRAEQHIASGLVSLSFALLLVPNALLSSAFLGHKISARFAVGSLLGIVGVGLMFARDLVTPGVDAAAIMLGLALAIGGVLSASVGNVMQATAVGRSLPPEGGLAWAMAYGGILNALVALVIAGPPAFDFSVTYIAGLAYLGIVASAVAFSLYYAIIRSIGPGKAAYSGVVVPLVAMALSTVFEGYIWTPLAVAGGVLAMIGLLVALRSRG